MIISLTRCIYIVILIRGIERVVRLEYKNAVQINAKGKINVKQAFILLNHLCKIRTMFS